VKRFRLQLTQGARRQVRDVSKWWRTNRAIRPELFREEFVAATQRLERLPNVGSSYPHEQVDGVRRVLLSRTRYHLYYVVDEQAAVVTILALWHSARGEGPTF
jgi:plasmid stabilization system protein ParE